MNQPLPRSAFFLPTPVAENSGVDFLGLRQANLDMMAELLPATNNVTAYIRPFALLSWIFWKFHDLSARTGRLTTTSDKITPFRERIEILFTWGARLHDIPRIPGKEANPPRSSGAMPLTFDAWKRTQTSTSLIAALWYGPASKTITGLGFIDPQGGGLFAAHNEGVKLAESLDRVLRTQHERYSRLLDTLADVKATENDARELWDLWSVYSPTPEECNAFRAALFDRTAIGDYKTPLGQRSSTIALAIFHLSQTSVPLSATEIRRGMYFSMTPDGSAYTVPDPLDPARRKWVILQVRQLQRLALETLLSWCERNVISWRDTNSEVSDTQTLTARAEKVLKAEYPHLRLDRPIASMISDLDMRFSTLDQFVAIGRTDPLTSPFTMMDTIVKAFADPDKVVAHCLYAIFLCASFSGCCADDEKRLVSVGGAPRLSLFHLRKRLVALGDVSLKTAIQFILESMVLSQHFATAVNRFDGQNQRLRLSIEESGLVPLVNEPWRPTITEDRLPTILQLCADCGLIQKNGDNYLA